METRFYQPDRAVCPAWGCHSNGAAGRDGRTPSDGDVELVGVN